MFFIEYFYVVTIIYIAFLKNQNYTNVILYFYLNASYILYNIKNNFNTVSSYYQLISFLNTKNNIFIVLIILLLFFKNKLKNHQKLVVYLYLYIYIFLLNLNLDISKLPFNLLLGGSNLNLNLLNGIMLIHPVILYIFYSLFLYEFFLNFKKLANFTKKNCKNTTKKNILILGLIILIADVLGG